MEGESQYHINEKEANKVIRSVLLAGIMFFVVGFWIWASNTINTKEIALVQQPPSKVNYEVREDSKFYSVVWEIAITHYPTKSLYQTWKLVSKANEIENYDLKKGDVLIVPQPEVWEQ